MDAEAFFPSLADLEGTMERTKETPKPSNYGSSFKGSAKGSDRQVSPKAAPTRAEGNLFQDILDDLEADLPKYITLNQVNVKIAGGTDKLLVVRDVTSIVLNENIMATKREMAKLTDILLRQVEDHSNVVEQKLQRVD